MGPAPGVMFYIGLYRENTNKSSSNHITQVLLQWRHINILLLTRDVFCIFQCGFFVRKQKDEMEKRMQHEGKVLLVDEDDDIPTKK